MDGRAHERPLDDLSLLERAVEMSALEALDSRPETDVHGRCVLRLERAHPLEDAWNRQPNALE